MRDNAMEISRYTLAQDYVIDENRNVETFWTAVISIIGYEPLTDFKTAMAALNYGEGRFRSLNPSVAGRWIEQLDSPARTEQPVPGMLLGLIFVNIDSYEATVRTWTEIKRYSATGNIPIIACCAGRPEQMEFAKRIKQLSADHDVSYHFAQIDDVDKCDADLSSAITKRTIYFLEAVLSGVTYPGLICVDLADVFNAIKGRKTLHIFRISAPSFAQLMESLTVEFGVGVKINLNKPSVIATLFAPSSLKLNQVADCFSTLKCIMRDDSLMVSAALADADRTEYTLYLV